MKNLGRPPRISAQDRLLDLLTTQFDDVPQANALFADFLQHNSYSRCLCLKLLDVAQAADAAWDIRRLAVLMLEHQILKIDTSNLDEFDFLFAQLNLKAGSTLKGAIVSSVLKEGYSSTNPRHFIPEFRSRLQRLNRVHTKIRGWRTSEESLRDFIDLSRRDCKLSLARYLFTAEEVVNEILHQILVSDGAKDLDSLQPAYVDSEAERAINLLPDFEASILRRLCAASRIYWVSEWTSAELNSLVEYPLTTVALTIKPPGSNVEFEIKRAGRKSPLSLNVVHARDGYEVAPSHRLDGGNMQWLLRHEAKSAAQFGLVYRLVHDTEAPIPNYVARSTIYSIPVNGTQAQTLIYFTEPRIFGEGFGEMRQAMADVVAAFRAEGYVSLPELPGDLGLTAQFIATVSPAQAILNGTSSFRLDRLAAYLASDGARRYFEAGLDSGYSKHDGRRLADSVLEEILGVYHSPDVRYQSHKQYLAAAYAVPANRAKADSVYLSIMQEIGKVWGTLLGVRGVTRGESFVARNVGLRSVWDGGQWKVRIIFMDHDSLVIANPQDRDFNPQEALSGMTLDETYLWGKGSILGTVGHLRRIYRISDELGEQGKVLARVALKKAYKKTQHEVSSDPELRELFHPDFVERLFAWDKLVKGYLRIKPDSATSSRWKGKQRELLAEKTYEGHEFDTHMEAIENNRAFLERYSFLF